MLPKGLYRVNFQIVLFVENSICGNPEFEIDQTVLISVQKIITVECLVAPRLLQSKIKTTDPTFMYYFLEFSKPTAKLKYLLVA